MQTSRSLLVLDGHTNQALATVRSLGRAGHRVFVAGSSRGCLASWSRHCAAAVRVDAETRSDFATLRKWAAQRQIEVVLPMTERSCILCNLDRHDWERSGIIVGCAPAATLGAAFDKRETLALAAAAGVRVPRTIAPRSLAEARDAADAVGYPCVIKPRFSHPYVGGQFLPDYGCAYAATAHDIDAVVLSRRQGEAWPLVQAWVAGSGKGVFALCEDGYAVAWFAHQRLRDVRPSGSGSSVRRSVALAARLREPSERLLREMRWHGPAMVEFRDSEHEPPCLMEVNGRFWTSLQLAIEAGVDFPKLWLSILLGDPLASPLRYDEGVVVRWLWGDVKRFLYVLAGPPAGFTGTFPTISDGIRELFGRQSPGTRLEIWQRNDPWPAVGEWTEAAREVWKRARTS
jgi:predicted ATP-grasp superfamily ATP-dependent carboligase